MGVDYIIFMNHPDTGKGNMSAKSGGDGVELNIEAPTTMDRLKYTLDMGEAKALAQFLNAIIEAYESPKD